MTTTSVFEKFYKRLNPAQKQAVDEIEGAVMVIAGPGTGKTQILTLRIANILQKTQINPENILALTFTESGASEMRKRLVDIIGTPGYRVTISTFHGFCNEIIQKYPEDFDELISSQSINELEQIQIVEEIITARPFEFIKPVGDPTYYIKPALSAINELKKENVSVEQLRQVISKMEIDYQSIPDLQHEKGVNKGKVKTKYQDILRTINKNRELATIYRDYQDMLMKRKKYDFNDMLLEVINALKKDSQLLLRLQEQYQYFLIDEHQDTNAAQNTIIELLASFYKNPNLFVVGDSKQAIFRFQGATLENFLYFKNLYTDAILINLTHNYRSTQSILNAAGSLISHNQKKDAINDINLIATANYENNKISLATFTDYFSEYYWLAQELKKKIDAKIDPSGMAILVRNNRDIVPIADALEHLKIPSIVETDQNVLDDLEIEKILILLRTINNLGEDLHLIRAMHIDVFSINPLDSYKLVLNAKKEKTSVWDLVATSTNKKIHDFYIKLTGWKIKSENASFDDLFISVINESGIMKRIVNKKNALSTLDKISVLYGEVKISLSKDHLYNLCAFLDYVDLLRIHNLAITQKPFIGRKNAIRIMTVHKSKGLEFDYVYIPQAYDTHWGNQRKKGAPFTIPWEHLTIRFDKEPISEINEDERRLFYVAITRAKRNAVISYSTASLEGREQIPSQFIEEIDSSFIQSLSTQDFENNFVNHKEIILIPHKESQQEIIDHEYKENQKFFQELFLERGLSVSGLNNYLVCPWRYFFRNLLTIPDVKELSAIFGTAVHKALNRYLSLQNREGFNETFILQEFNKSLSEQALSEAEIEQLSHKGEKILPGFYKSEIITWNTNMQSELVVRGVKLNDQIMLNGRIDMMEMRDRGHKVIVHDFKTGKPKSRNEIEGKTFKSSGDYKRQLVFYKILLDRYQQGRLKMSEGVINFVQPNDRGIYKKEVFVISDTEVEQLEETIVQVGREIMNFSFWDKRCDDQKCEYCMLRDLIKA